MPRGDEAYPQKEHRDRQEIAEEKKALADLAKEVDA